MPRNNFNQGSKDLYNKNLKTLLREIKKDIQMKKHPVFMDGEN